MEPITHPLLELDDFCVAYPQQTDWAVETVSLALQPGEMLGLVGESGCGKSTLGRAALKLLPKGSRTQGRSLFEGRNVFEFSAQEIRRFRGEAVSLVFQDPMTRLNPLMTIGDHCVETLRAHRSDLSRQAAKEMAIATLQSVSIPPSRWEQYPHEFSGGMRQRVAIALALLLNPKLIVADEPTTSLDVTVSAQILALLTQLCRQRDLALILISHDLALVGEYCDRIAVMYQGKLVEMGATQQVLYHPQADYTKSLLQAAHQLQNYETGAESEPTAAPLLRVQDLVKHYTIEPNLLTRLFNRTPPETIRAVDGISVDLHPGEILGLVGESGCGKSTFSRTLMQIIPPTSGRVDFRGQNLVGMSRPQLQAQRREFQMIFQDPHACLNPMMTVGRGIADPLIIHGLA
ncbi:MAG: ABC transporter ATP-binding protein, partial [Cyanobacteria bacterium P01_D01_bin.2]